MDSLHLGFADARAEIGAQFVDFGAQLRDFRVVMRLQRFFLRCGARGGGVLLGSERLDGLAKVADEVRHVVCAHGGRRNRRGNGGLELRAFAGGGETRLRSDSRLVAWRSISVLSSAIWLS